MTALELSFQFPIKRDGASPVAAAGSIVTGASVVSSMASSVASGAADSVTAGSEAGASSESFPEFEMTIAASNTTATRTAKSVLPYEPLRGAALGFAAAAFTAGFAAAGAGVVETFTGVDALKAVAFLTALFLATAFLVVVFFFATAFLATAFFLAVVFLATVFLTALFFATDFFFAALFFAGDFFTAFLTALFFLTATVYLLE